MSAEQRQLGQTACQELDSLGVTMMHRAMIEGKCGLLAPLRPTDAEEQRQLRTDRW